MRRKGGEGGRREYAGCRTGRVKEGDDIEGRNEPGDMEEANSGEGKNEQAMGIVEKNDGKGKNDAEGMMTGSTATGKGGTTIDRCEGALRFGCSIESCNSFARFLSPSERPHTQIQLTR